MKIIKYLLLVLIAIFLISCAGEPHEHAFLGVYEVTSEYHYRTCQCGLENKENHIGGEATCQELAKCEICKAEYGELLQCDYELKKDDTKHWLECSMCHDVKDELAHEYELTNDEEYHYNTCECGHQIKEQHFGGEATCQELAKCEVCNVSYGEVISCEYEEKYNDTLHWLECNMCHDVKDELAHEYELTNDEEYHYNTCECGHQIKEQHFGGEATCQELAKCEVCEKSYGNLISCDYEQRKDDTKHWLECSMCHDVKDELEHQFSMLFDEDGHYKHCECGVETVKETHEYNAGVITLDATDKSDGIKTYECLSCDHINEKTIPMVAGYEVESYPQFSNADTVYYEGNIYSYGGNAAGRTNSIYRYNVNTDKLYKLDVKLDLETTSHRVVLVGNKVYIFGGLGNSGARRFSVLVHDLEKQTLEELGVTLPFGINCFQVGYYENCIYMIGGTGSNGNFSKIYTFNLETFEFNELPVSLPTVVFKGAWCYVGKYAYVIGGTNGKRLTSIYRFDMENHTVETMNATLPEQISQSRAVYDGEGNIYIYGGTNESNQLVDYVVKYDIANDKAELMSYKLPLVLANICTVMTDKGIYILGGNNDYIDIIIKHDGDEFISIREAVSIV